MDLYPREDKYSHAASFVLLKRSKVGNETQKAASAIVTNFNPPMKGKPSLLIHSQVTTFFHEFGHVMHNMCSEANYSRFSGTSVEKDFVEMPSQMLENWIWDKDILKKVSKHYQTGEPLPDDVIEKKIASKTAHQALDTLEQIFRGTLDLLLYTASDKKLLAESQKLSQLDGISLYRKNIKMKDGGLVDTEDLWHTLASQIQFSNYQDGTNPIGMFGHIFSGYTSSYYSYLWSKVYSCDLF